MVVWSQNIAAQVLFPLDGEKMVEIATPTLDIFYIYKMTERVFA